MTMEQVISEAMLNHRSEDGPPSVCVAAAARAHMLSDAVVERAARSICKSAGWDYDVLPFNRDDWCPGHLDEHGISATAPTCDDYLNWARAAIRAAVASDAEG